MLPTSKDTMSDRSIINGHKSERVESLSTNLNDTCAQPPATKKICIDASNEEQSIRDTVNYSSPFIKVPPVKDETIKLVDTSRANQLNTQSVNFFKRSRKQSQPFNWNRFLERRAEAEKEPKSLLSHDHSSASTLVDVIGETPSSPKLQDNIFNNQEFPLRSKSFDLAEEPAGTEKPEEGGDLYDRGTLLPSKPDQLPSDSNFTGKLEEKDEDVNTHGFPLPSSRLSVSTDDDTENLNEYEACNSTPSNTGFPLPSSRPSVSTDDDTENLHEDEANKKTPSNTVTRGCLSNTETGSVCDVNAEKSELTLRDIPRPELRIRKLDLAAVRLYLSDKKYPLGFRRKQKVNFKKQVKPFLLEKGRLMYKRRDVSVPVITERRDQLKYISMAHEGEKTSNQAVALSGHRGRDSVVKILRSRAYWPGQYGDVCEYIKTCENCQRVNTATVKIVPELHPVKVPKEVFRQIGIDIRHMPEAYGKKYIVVAVDYFSKWSEALAIEDKKAETVAQFLYDFIYTRHGFPKVQINDQGREFVNSVAEKVFLLTGTRQRICSAYHPQANGLVERENRTLTNFLLKVLMEQAHSEWPLCLNGVLFAHRTMEHSSTGFSPFFLLYGRDPILAIDLLKIETEKSSETDETSESDCKDGKDAGKDVNENGDTDIKDMIDVKRFHKVLRETLKIQDACRGKVHDEAMFNIENAQKKQKKYYDRRHAASNDNLLKVGEEVLLYTNLRNKSRKGGKEIVPHSQHVYRIEDIDSRKNCTLFNITKGTKVVRKHPMVNLKPYFRRPNHLQSEECAESQMNANKQEVNVKTEEGEPEPQPATITKMEPMSDNDGPVRDDSSNDGQIHILGEYKLSCLDWDFKFLHVGEEWQRNTAALLELPVHEIVCHQEAAVPLGSPKEKEKIRGDGNCFFRSLSYLITGDQKHHLEIRRKICESLSKYAPEFPETTDPRYLRKMETSREWATDIEVCAAARLLGAPIFTWTRSTSLPGGPEHPWRWSVFSHHMLRYELLSNATPAIYLDHAGTVHYDVVLKVKTPEEDLKTRNVILPHLKKPSV